MARLTPGGLATSLLQILSIGCGIAIVVIVSEKLWILVGGFAWKTWFGWTVTSSGNVCLMTTHSANLCSYTYVVAGISWIISILILVAQCCGGRRGCKAMVLGGSVFAVLWWIAAAVVGTVYGKDADNDALPAKGWRTSVWALGWAQVGLFALTLLAAAFGEGAPTSGKAQAAAAPAGAYPPVGHASGDAGGPPTGSFTSNPTYVTDYKPPPAPAIV